MDELRSPSGGQEVGKDAVIAGARQRGLNRKTSVVRLFRMNMVEVVQILAYDKEMESLVVYNIEFPHLLARDRILNLKSQANPLAGTKTRGFDGQGRREVNQLRGIHGEKFHAAPPACSRLSPDNVL